MSLILVTLWRSRLFLIHSLFIRCIFIVSYQVELYEMGMFSLKSKIVESSNSIWLKLIYAVQRSVLAQRIDIKQSLPSRYVKPGGEADR